MGEMIKNLLLPYKIPLIIGGIIILCVIAWWISCQFPVSSYIDDFLNQRYSEIKKQYENDIKERDKKIEELNSKLEISNGKIQKLTTEIDVLRKKKESINEPKTIKETKDRLRGLGFNPR